MSGLLIHIATNEVRVFPERTIYSGCHETRSIEQWADRPDVPLRGARSLMAASAHILVVDDHAEIRHSVTRYLPNIGIMPERIKTGGGAGGMMCP